MARKAKPWWWEQRGEYCATIAGKRYRLGTDKDEAKKQLGELLKKAKEDRVSSGSVASVIDLFLDWAEKNNAPETFAWYKKHLQSFLDSLADKRLTVHRLKAHHVSSWVDSRGWKGSYKRGAMTAVARCFNWASKEGHIEQSPLRGKLTKPPAGKRERSISPAEYRKILKHVTGDFRDLVVTAWETGARPQEITRVEARHVDLPNGRWVFPEQESKGKRTKRVVYLSKTALAITKRLMKKYPGGHLFRRNGVAWDRYMMSNEFARLKKQCGERFRLYDFRFSFCTNGLKNGVDVITMQHLMGHKDLSMISKVYALVSQDVNHMRKSAMLAVK